MTEREEVRLRKEADPFSKPWTRDPILRRYKFTNVRRHHDRTSSELIDLFYDDHQDSPKKEILMNCALARYFGTYEFMEAVGWQSFDDFDFEGIKETARLRLESKPRQRVFTGAYVITNQGISAPKQEVVVDYFLRPLHAKAEEICTIVEETSKWEEVSIAMRKIPGFGGSGFMTKETLLDTTYTNFWKDTDTDHIPGNEVKSIPFDWNSWTPIGPGARRGLARLSGKDVPGNGLKVSEADMNFLICEIAASQDLHWNKDKYGVLSPTDIQFQLCEFDKYERVRLGQGRLRSKYKGI